MAVGTRTISRPCTIVLHEDAKSHLDVLGGTDILPVGSIAHLSCPSASDILIIAEGHAVGPREISLHVRLGTKYGIGNRTHGRITIVEDEDDVAASYIEIFFRDQYLSRTDMWLMTKQLEGRVIHKDSPIRYLGYDVATIREIHMPDGEVDSALVQQGKTKAILRSGSARFTMLVQVSKEMLEYCSSGDLMYEKLVDGFLSDLFQRWDSQKVRHQVSVVLFGRQRVDNNSWNDFYHVLHLDIANTQRREILRSLKCAFNHPDLPQDVSLAASGNMLEAIHISALDFLEGGEALHFTSAGTAIIAITAGRGTFDADYALLKKTTNILLGHSIGVDIVSLSSKPAHPVPIFKYEIDGAHEHAMPHWAELSHWSAGDPGDTGTRTFKPAVDMLKDISIPNLQPLIDGIEYTEIMFAQHDDGVFRSTKADHFNMESRIPAAYLSTSLESNKTVKARSPKLEQLPALATAPPLKQQPSSSSTATAASLNKQSRSNATAILTNRKISLGPRGLAPLKSSAITTISETHASQGLDLSTASKFTPNEMKSGLANQIRASLKRRPSSASMTSRLTDSDDKSTQPIDIQQNLLSDMFVPPQAPEELEGLSHDPSLSKITRSNSRTPKAFDGMASSPHMTSGDPGAEARTPWLTLLNPCNIKKDKMRVASQYRQWQHVFPKTIDSGEFKWTSMCSPAALPLYNDLCPRTEDLKKFYKRATRRLICSQSDNQAKRPQELMKQLVTLRLAHGFQFVTLPHNTEQDHVLMSIGADYHELQCLSPLELEIVEYVHNSTDYINISYYAEGYSRTFDVMPLYSTVPVTATTNFAESELLLDWSIIDQSIDSASASSSIFRLRFVLLPIETSRGDQAEGLADDEKRIEGIQRLTQQWQRHRVFTAEDQSHLVSVAKKKGTRPEDEVDHNPLAIEYHTRDPSALVNSQDVSVTGDINQDVLRVPLFQESERYHSSTFDIAKLVRQMQEEPPRGVGLRDRRWFARIHLRCFRGDEMTTWLLGAFKDLQTRDEAVDIGNVLMDRGLFTHVRYKHPFKDGHYFYQVAPKHRTIEHPSAIASVFNRGSMRSIPPTPNADARMSPQVRPVVKGDSDSSGTDSSLLGPIEKKQVLLSQMLRYNVDPGHVSEQEEIINIHYDRIHNPENCYHIYIDWTLTTPMLIQNALAKWAALIEPYGLRLMQVPWLEASTHSRRHPFEQPHYIKLAIEPPERIPSTPQFGSSSSARGMEDRQFYHKAILRKLGYVLDEESSDSYSNKVEVSMTCGTIDFSMTQFVHRTGLVIAQISNDQHWDFLLLPNTLLTERAYSSARTQHKDSIKSLIQDFRSMAENVKTLKTIFDEAIKPKIVTSSPFNAAHMTGADLDVPPMQLPPLVLSRGL